MKIGVKKIAMFSIVLVFSFILVGCSFEDETKIGVMSMSQVLNQSQRAQELQTELENFNDQKQNFEFRKERNRRKVKQRRAVCFSST